IDYWPPPAAPALIAGLLPPRGFAEPVVLVERHRISPERKSAANHHQMPRPLILEPSCVAIGRPHHELALPDHHQYRRKRCSAEHCEVGEMRSSRPDGGDRRPPCR